MTKPQALEVKVARIEPDCLHWSPPKGRRCHVADDYRFGVPMGLSLDNRHDLDHVIIDLSGGAIERGNEEKTVSSL